MRNTYPSIHSYTSKAPLSTNTPERKHVHGEKQQAKEKMILLINSVYYFLHKVFILFDGTNYRLVVIKDNAMLMDKKFPTLKGAKISFARIYGPMACQKDVAPIWSVTYSPYLDWLNSELSCPLKRYH